MTHHLAILQVVLPLIAAPICSLINHGKACWLFATTVAWLVFAMSLTLFLDVQTGGSIRYEIGGWQPPWGIEYHIDALAAFVLLLVSAMAAITLSAFQRSIAIEIPKHKQGLFYTAFLLCLTGLLGIVATGDAFNIFVFLEISSLSAYALIALGRDRRALTASFEYLIMGTIGATFILIGIGLLYMQTGTLNIADLQARIPEISHLHSVHAAFAFFTIGIFLKLALFPLHHWLPGAYAYAPSAVSTFLAATATKVALYLLYRVFYTVFGFEFSFEVLQLHYILMPLSILAIIISSLNAIFQQDVKKMLAYSSLGQIGYMTLGISLLSDVGLIASILHLFNHAFIKGALFMTMACFLFRTPSMRLDDLNGAGRTMPWVGMAFVLGGLGLIGIPLTSGFISKWFLVSAVIEQGHWWLVAIIVFSSLLALIYVWRVVEHLFFREPSAALVANKQPIGALLPFTWIVLLSTLYFGINSDFPVQAAKAAAKALQ